MYTTDPYQLVGNKQEGKVFPNFHLYSYNFLKKYDKLDYAFLGSSAVNYYDIGYMYGNNPNIYSMGIESSTIEEQIAFGKLLAEKHPKEITFFLSFYSFNPSRARENYFNKFVVLRNSTLVDFVYQYFNKTAFFDALKYVKKNRQDTSWAMQFNPDGTRTQNHYKLDKAYNFDSSLADYLALNYSDKRLYGSRTFKEPASIDKAMEQIGEFKSFCEEKNIKLNIVIAPDYRMNTVLIYYMGLGKTYEHLRIKLAEIQLFYDLNLDTTFTCNHRNYWDAHHVRDGKYVMDDLKSTDYLLKKENVESTFEILRPKEKETEKLKSIFFRYKNWERAKKISEEDIKQTPLLAE